MTVAELIEKLGEYRPDQPVVLELREPLELEDDFDAMVEPQIREAQVHLPMVCNAVVLSK